MWNLFERKHFLTEKYSGLCSSVITFGTSTEILNSTKMIKMSNLKRDTAFQTEMQFAKSTILQTKKAKTPA